MNITPEKAHMDAFLSGDGTAGHSKGNWTTKHEVIYSGDNLFISRPDYSTMGVMPSERLSNCNLMALAQHAPHDCGDPECPGVVNKRKLTEYNELFRRLQVAETEIVRQTGCDPNEIAHLYNQPVSKPVVNVRMGGALRARFAAEDRSEEDRRKLELYDKIVVSMTIKHAFYSQKQSELRLSQVNEYRLLNGEVVTVTAISDSPLLSNQNWDDSVYLGQVAVPDGFIRTIKKSDEKLFEG